MGIGIDCPALLDASASDEIPSAHRVRFGCYLQSIPRERCKFTWIFSLFTSLSLFSLIEKDASVDLDLPMEIVSAITSLSPVVQHHIEENH